LRFGPVAHSDEGLQLVSESYPRHSRPVAAVGWRNSDRNGRTRMSNDRYRVSEETSLQDRFSSEVCSKVDAGYFILPQARRVHLFSDN
jgi:hypothetical protein